MFFNIFPLTIINSFLFYSKVPQDKRENFFNKHSTDFLRGICAIIVILNHYAQHISAFSLVGRIFMYSGSCAVGLFFLISGYANYLSYCKKINDKLHWLKKVVQVIAIVEIINIIDNRFFEQMWYIKKLDIFNSGYWFIFTLIAFYVVLNFAIRFNMKYSTLILWVIIIIYMVILIWYGKPSTWYNSVACFALGVTIGKYKEKLLDIFEKVNIQMISLFLIPIIIFMYSKMMTIGAPYDTITALLFNILIVLYLYQYELKSKIWEWLGVISLELFMWHEKMLFRIITVNGQVYTDITYFIIFITMSILLSYLSHWIVKKCIGLINIIYSKNNYVQTSTNIKKSH